ncbi:FAD-dependent oxidoreductase [Sporosalibacterium faouarense]|uniref:bile acid Fe-S flavoenzyme BaiCD n=1 Tax=Sporosalibacterium faouarense TaxID=516123 RepID=UPI00192C062D|nr:FAD-dependent oxidoreductase [Sporosalibacterium faouarense]
MLEQNEFTDYHVARTVGGCGLNITEAASVHGPSAPRDLLLHIWDDKFLPGLKKFTSAIHGAGGKACVQLWQGGPAAGLSDPEAMFIIPSDTNVYGKTIPGASLETIRDVVDAFGTAAKRAVEAGFDCVEFHVAHGYSPHCFLSAAMNKRTDEYGGSLENRARYSLEIIESIRKNIPEDMPLLMRVVSQDDYVEDGLTIGDIIKFCNMAKEAGVNVLDVSRGNKFPIGTNNFGMKLEVPPIDVPKGFNVDNAARIKEETGMITIGVGRINSPDQAEEILDSGKTDMVVIGRGLIADSEFCKKAYDGEEDSIIKCVACNQGCYDRLTAREYRRISCMRNPAVGREKEFAIVKTNSPKKVLVAGGGLAGLEAAITLKLRGHEPILLEESGLLGGQFLLAGLAPRKGEMREAAISRGQQARKLGVDIRLNTKVTSDVLQEISPDSVIVATGAEPIKPNIPGTDFSHVVSSFDVLEGKVLPEGNVVIIGGGLVGLEVAEYISEKSKSSNIAVVEMLDGVGKDLGLLRKVSVMENLASEGIKTMVSTKCSKINKDSVELEKGSETQKLSCDYVVIAIGSKSKKYDEIKQFCETNDMPYYVIGDAKKARRAVNAISEAAELSRII